MNIVRSRPGKFYLLITILTFGLHLASTVTGNPLFLLSHVSLDTIWSQTETRIDIRCTKKLESINDLSAQTLYLDFVVDSLYLLKSSIF